MINIPELNKKPVYTQAMTDDGELPKVGMKCIFKHGGYDTEGTVTTITKEYIVLTECTGKERIRKLSESPVRPIDTRTDKEKAVDGILKAITSLPTWSDKSKSIVSAIKSGKIHGVKWVGE